MHFCVSSFVSLHFMFHVYVLYVCLFIVVGKPNISIKIAKNCFALPQVWLPKRIPNNTYPPRYTNNAGNCTPQTVAYQSCEVQSGVTGWLSRRSGGKERIIGGILFSWTNKCCSYDCSEDENVGCEDKANRFRVNIVLLHYNWSCETRKCIE